MAAQTASAEEKRAREMLSGRTFKARGTRIWGMSEDEELGDADGEWEPD